MKFLKIKRAALFILGLNFFLFPGQNYYSVVQASWHTPQTRRINFEPPPVAFYPVDITGVSAPNLTAYSAVVKDNDSAVPLYGKNEKLPLLPASTVKIMTALVSLEHYRLDDVLTVEEVFNLGQGMKLVKGEKISVKNLLYGLLVASANDAATLLARGFPGAEKSFVDQMNQKAKDLHLDGTYFTNPTGLDTAKDGKLLKEYSHTTALDLARLTNWALKNPIFSEMVATKKILVTDISGSIKHELENVNILLGKIEGLKGVKTGWTEEAGECLVSYVERDNHKIITVVLGSTDRFGETTRLIDWAFANYQWQDIIPSTNFLSQAQKP